MTCPRCRSTTVGRRQARTALGYRRFWCRSCRHHFNERTGTPFNELQYPTDIVLLAVLCVAVEAVLTDNGIAYRAHRWHDTCNALGLRHLRTRPYTPTDQWEG